MPLSRAWPKESTCVALGRLAADFGQLGAFSDHDDAVLLAVVVVVSENSADMIQIDGLLGNQHDMRSAGNARSQRDPAGVASHHFADDDAVVRLGGGVQSIDRFGGDHHRRIEAEADVGAVEVVVDGLGNANAGHAGLNQRVGDGLRIVTADGDQRIELVGLEDLDAFLDPALDFAHIGPRGTKNRAALDQNLVHFLQRQLHGVVVEDAAPAFQESDKLVAVVIDAFPYDRMNDRIQSGAIAAAGQHTNSHRFSPCDIYAHDTGRLMRDSNDENTVPHR